jgi:hypothetical protein
MGSISLQTTFFPPRIATPTVPFLVAHPYYRNCFNLWEIPFICARNHYRYFICFGSINPIHAILNLPTSIAIVQASLKAFLH